MAVNAKPTLLIDASIYIFQYYFSLPDNWFSDADTFPTAAVYGYTTFLTRLLDIHCPQRIAVCFDESLHSCFRNSIYPHYKSSRALPDEALAFQLAACRQVTALLGIQTYGSKTHEADDLLGSLYQRLTRSKTPIAVLTRDKDLGQLLCREQDFLWDYAKDQRYYISHIQQKWGVWPHQLVDYLALVGDTVDDIPGVPGIGAKTAQQLLARYDSIDALLNSIDELTHLPLRGATRIAKNLRQYRQQIHIAQQLATIVTNLNVIKTVDELRWRPPQWQLLEAFCMAMGFPQLFSRIQRLQVHF
jgi:5'-3' exonuclease